MVEGNKMKITKLQEVAKCKGKCNTVHTPVYCFEGESKNSMCSHCFIEKLISLEIEVQIGKKVNILKLYSQWLHFYPIQNYMKHPGGTSGH